MTIIVDNQSEIDDKGKEVIFALRKQLDIVSPTDDFFSCNDSIQEHYLVDLQDNLKSQNSRFGERGDGRILPDGWTDLQLTLDLYVYSFDLGKVKV